MTDIADLRQRFFSKIAPDPGSNCILWAGARRPKGYGLLSVDGVLKSATHVSWFLKYGVWPADNILHRCDNPPCVNPDLLFEGTHADNAADRDAKGRHWTPAGSDHPFAKLDYFDVCEIVALTDTNKSLHEIGALFGIGASYVSSLRHGRYRGVGSPRTAKPKAAKEYDVGGRMLTIKEIAVEAGVSSAAIEYRIQQGITGAELLKPKHKAPRKPYVRHK